MGIQLMVRDETAELETVVLGIADDQGIPGLNNPKAEKHFNQKTYPKEKDIAKEISQFERVLLDNNVKVLRPNNLKDTNQIFVRDIGFVIEDKFIVSKMGAKKREKEIEGLESIFKEMSAHDKKCMNIDEATIEGGDVVLYGDKIFIGESRRTNDAGFEFIKKTFPNKEVIQIEITPNENAKDNVLHLDCAFQPIGLDSAIIYPNGLFYPDKLKKHFAKSKIIEVSKKEAYDMFPNIFSISPTKIVIERKFHRLKEELKKRKFEVFEVDYFETSKISGLLRCSTLPLKRKYN